MRALGFLFLAALLCPTQAVGQSSPYRAQLEAAAKLRPATPSLALDARPRSSGDLAPEQRRFSSRAPGATLMIIGGAAIIAGAVAGGSGGTVLILAGVGVGAYGFYLYTR